MLTFEHYRYAVHSAIERHPDWRRGQAHFNVLYGLRPDLAEAVRGDHAHRDPFYLDENIPAFLEFVHEHW